MRNNGNSNFLFPDFVSGSARVGVDEYNKESTTKIQYYHCFGRGDSEGGGGGEKRMKVNDKAY